MIPQAAQEPTSHATMWTSPVSEPTPVTNAAVALQETTEASVIQPVRAGRGARLSFLGGKKKDQPKPNGDQQARSRGPSYSQPQTRTQRSGTQSSANTDSAQSRARSGSGNAPRRNLFRHEAPPPTNGDSGSDWVTDSNPRASLEIGDKDGDKGVGIHKMGSVRRRLSMLKIGKRGGSVRDRTVMGSLDEE